MICGIITIHSPLTTKKTNHCSSTGRRKTKLWTDLVTLTSPCPEYLFRGLLILYRSKTSLTFPSLLLRAFTTYAIFQSPLRAFRSSTNTISPAWTLRDSEWFFKDFCKFLVGFEPTLSLPPIQISSFYPLSYEGPLRKKAKLVYFPIFCSGSTGPWEPRHGWAT